MKFTRGFAMAVAQDDHLQNRLLLPDQHDNVNLHAAIDTVMTRQVMLSFKRDKTTTKRNPMWSQLRPFML